VAAQLIDTVVRRAIQHDLRMGERGRRRDEPLLEEVFRLSCRCVGQTPSQAIYLDEVRRSLDANMGWQRVPAYLKFPDAALLVRLIEPLELRLQRRKGSPNRILSDHALRAAWLQGVGAFRSIDGVNRLSATGFALDCLACYRNNPMSVEDKLLKVDRRLLLVRFSTCLPGSARRSPPWPC